MTDAERDAILSICLLAAFADGISDERERAEIERIAGSLQRRSTHEHPTPVMPTGRSNYGV